MNTTNTNIGGWESSYMRNTICPQFLNALPTEWKNAIVACTKYTDNKGGGTNITSNVTATQDKIFLLGGYEVIVISSGAFYVEKNYQKQYDYYKNGNSHVKYKHVKTDNVCSWWLRSPTSGYSGFFLFVGSDSVLHSQNANFSFGFAPGFKIA